MAAEIFRKTWLPGLLATLMMLLVVAWGPMTALETQAFTLFSSWNFLRAPSQNVSIVSIDDSSFDAFGTWPWPPAVFAKITRRLAADHARAIGYVLPVSIAGNSKVISTLEGLAKGRRLGRRQREQLMRSAGELKGVPLVKAIQAAGNVVIGLPVARIASGEGISLPSAVLKKSVAVNPAAFHARGMRLLPGRLASMSADLAAASAGIGYLPLDKSESNGQPLLMRFGSQLLPSFALALAARSQGLDASDIGVNATRSLRLGNRSIATDDTIRVIPPAGSGITRAFTVYPIEKVYTGDLPADTFAGKTVLIGVTAPEYARTVSVGLDADVPVVYAAARDTASLMDGGFYTRPLWSKLARWLVFAVVGLYLMLVVPRLGSLTSLILSLIGVVVLINAEFLLMNAQQVWIPLILPGLLLIIGHTLVWIRRRSEERMKRMQQQLSVTNRLLGQAYQSQGRLDQALERYSMCIPETTLIEQLYNLGLDYERRRDFGKAISVLNRVLRIKPVFRDVQQRISRLKKLENQYMLAGARHSSSQPVVLEGEDAPKATLGRYEIVRELGRGAMGVVYLGRDPKISRTVAIKTMALAEEFEAHELGSVRKRFFREAETAGRLSHPNIVTIYDVGEENDLAYIAMDYLASDTLQKYSVPGNQLPVSEVLVILTKVAEALDYAHSQQVVHRDIKPANIIYDPKSGRVKVTDFGVACLTDSSSTKTGTILGSPSYMSPEQLAGKHVDGRSDIFSLGVTLYQLLRGELPFSGHSLATLMYKITNETPQDVCFLRPDLPKVLSLVVNKAMSKNPDHRYQQAREMAVELRRCYATLTGRKPTQSSATNTRH